MKVPQCVLDNLSPRKKYKWEKVVNSYRPLYKLNLPNISLYVEESKTEWHLTYLSYWCFLTKINFPTLEQAQEECVKLCKQKIKQYQAEIFEYEYK